jgi:hypothetical protein
MDPSPPLYQRPWRQHGNQRSARQPTGDFSAGSTPQGTPYGSPQQTPGTDSLPVFPGFSAARPQQQDRPPLMHFNSYDSGRSPSAHGPGLSSASTLSTPLRPQGPAALHSRTGSASHLLSPETSFTYDDRALLTPEPYSPGFPPDAQPRERRRWYQHLQRWGPQRHPAWAMFFFLSLGLIGALSHHAFYVSLEGKEATDQLRMLRYGAALAFFTKACLAGAVIIAFRQRVWVSVRRNVFSVTAIDSLFAASEDFTALFNFEVFRAATLAMCLAIFVWSVVYFRRRAHD